MATHKKIESAMDEVNDDLESLKEQGIVDISVYSGRKKIHYINQFVVVFIKNLKTIVREYRLSNNEMIVLLTILEKMQMGNLVSLSFSAMAKELNMDPSNVAKIKKKFIRSKLMINMDGSCYINPHVIAYGGYSEVEKNKENIELLDKSYEEIQDTDLTPSIGTNYIRKQEKSKKSKEKVKKEIKEIIQDSNELLQNIEVNNPLNEKIEA